MKKLTKTKKHNAILPQRKQWLIVLGLVVILLAFAILVNGMDMIWNTNRSF